MDSPDSLVLAAAHDDTNRNILDAWNTYTLNPTPPKHLNEGLKHHVQGTLRSRYKNSALQELGGYPGATQPPKHGPGVLALGPDPEP